MKKKILSILLCFLILFNSLGNITVFSNDQRKVGDDPAITISGPSTISSRQQIELNVSISSSAGKLDKDGIASIKIPKNIVANSNDLTNNLVLDTPFYLADPAVTTDESGNYILNVAYDHTKIPSDEAFGAMFTIKFQAPVITSFPEDTVDFESSLILGEDNISSDLTTSEILKETPSLPILRKASTRPIGSVNGVSSSLMSLSDPSSNLFVISVNYSQRNIKQAKIVDVTPPGTELTDPRNYLPATGDATPYQHMRIAKVTARDNSGTPTAWSYVTSQFQDKISISDTGFSIEFGDLTFEDSYVVMYSEKIIEPTTPEEFGVRQNHVDLLSQDSIISSRDANLALDNSGYNQISMKKEVNQSSIASNEGEFEYSLTLSNNNGTLKAGTILTDPLPENTRYLSTIQRDEEYFSEGVYDSSLNSISYTLLKDMKVGESSKIAFKVSWEDKNASPGDQIVNRAYINYNGSNIYSNVTVTTLNGSAYLYKTDEVANPLAGAEFKIIDSNGEIIADHLISDENGFINSGILTPGKYQFIEVKAPEGYELDTTPVNFEVVAGQETPINLSKINKLSIPGDVVLTKVDSETNKVLQGAEFKLQDAEGNDIKTNLVSDESGQIIVQGLDSGQYQFVETKAPEGYILDNTPIIFVIQNAETEAVQITAKNKKENHDVILTKVDSETNKVLQGAEFKLQDAEGNDIKTNLVSDELGQIIVQGLDSGQYQFVETKAPLGYQLDSKTLKFSISKESVNSVQITMTNHKILDRNDEEDSSDNTESKKPNKKLPSAGDKSTVLLSLGGIMLLILSIYYIIKNKVIR